MPPFALTPCAQSGPAPCMMISDGDPGTAQTVAVMYQLVDQGAKDPAINSLALQIIQAANPRAYDFSGQRRAIFSWVQRNIRFVRDITGVETLRTARETVSRCAGDCDCMTILMCALLKTVGNQVRIVTIANNPADPDFSHVFPEVLEGNRWTAVDAARPDARYGRSPENYRRRFAWPNPSEASAMSGLRGYGLGQTAKELNASYRRLQIRRGMGRFSGRRLAGRRGMGRLGDDDDDFDFSGLATDISAATTGAANIIRATNTPSIANLSTAQLQQAALLQQTQASPAGYVNFFGSLVPTSTLLLGAAAVAALVILERR